MKSVTVFGGTGFLGRHVVRRLARLGAIVKVAARTPNVALSLKLEGTVGQVVPVYADLKKENSLLNALHGTDVVINLAAVLRSRGKRAFQAVNVEGAAHVASCARRAGAGRFIHISTLALPETQSLYAQTKRASEVKVREAFPEAVILRPGALFGAEDHFSNAIARFSRYSPIVPVSSPASRFQPLNVQELAKAIVACAQHAHPAPLYEIGGDTVINLEDLTKLILKIVGRPHRVVLPLPYALDKALGRLWSLLPHPPITVDEVRLLHLDQVCTGQFPGLKDLGIKPVPLPLLLASYLERPSPALGMMPPYSLFPLTKGNDKKEPYVPKSL